MIKKIERINKLISKLYTEKRKVQSKCSHDKRIESKNWEQQESRWFCPDCELSWTREWYRHS